MRTEVDVDPFSREVDAVEPDAITPARELPSGPEAVFDDCVVDVDASLRRLVVDGESTSGVKARAAARTDGLRRAIFRSDGGGGGISSESDASSSGGVSDEFNRGGILAGCFLIS